MDTTSLNQFFTAYRSVLLFSLAILIILIVIRLIIASFAADRLQSAAEAKGMDSVYGWTILLGILNGLLGIAICALIVIAMPGKKKDNGSEDTNDIDLDQILNSRKK